MDWNGGSEKGLLWRLPTLKMKELGKLGPGIGLGAGCGVGFGIGLIGGDEYLQCPIAYVFFFFASDSLFIFSFFLLVLD